MKLPQGRSADRTAQVNEHRSQRTTSTADKNVRRDEFRGLRDKKMKEQYEELTKIIGKKKADKWNELRQNVRDYNRSGRMGGGRCQYRNNQQSVDKIRNYNNRDSYNMMRMSPQERVELMTKKLDLTDKEASEVLALCKRQEADRIAQMNEHKNKRATGTVDRNARREEFRALRDKQMKEHDEELIKIIGKERVDKWNQLRQDVRDFNRVGRMSGGRGYYRNNGRNMNNNTTNPKSGN